MKHTVDFKLTAHYRIEVDSDNMDNAYEKALCQYLDHDFGDNVEDIETINWKVRSADGKEKQMN